MRNSFTRTASLILAFGLLFIGCSTLSPSESQTPGSNNLSQQELEEELEKINSTITDSGGSEDPDIYFRKGQVLSELAQRQGDPEDRSPVYEDMQRALARAEQLYSRSGLRKGQQKVDELLQVRWSNEHNQGVEIIQSDSLTLDNDDYKQAATHFHNATTILPDSAISYKLKARAHYHNDQLKEAIETLEKAHSQISPLPLEMLEQLAFLYLETGQAQKATGIYEEAEDFADDNLNIIHGLANAYISVGNHEKAVELLDHLTETEPENVIYGQTRGTELYFLATQKVDKLLESANPRYQVPAEDFHQIDSLFTEAEQQLTETLNSNQSDTKLQQKVAFFYKNSAASYQRLLPYLPEDLTEEVNRKIKSHLQSAIPLFIALTEEQPDNTSLWRNLHQIYTYLEMDKKAEEIESKINQ